MIPDWIEHAIWWHVYPLGFTGADPTGADRSPDAGLDRIVDWLDYAVRLGVSGVLLGPTFDSATHGYDTVDYYRIDPRLGDDLGPLITAAHDRGLRVLLDGVFNHAAPGFVRSDLLSDTTFEGHAGLRTFDHGDPAVADLVANVLGHWCDRGVDGWRLDAAYAVPSAFWAEVLPRVRADRPEAFFFGEVIHGDYAAIVAESTMDSVTQYELWKAIWSSFNDGNLFELAWALDRHNGFLDTFPPVTFVGNHDVTRIASRLDDPDHLPLALAVLATVGGIPTLYYGDEQAFTGVKEERAGGDDAVRPAFPARPEELAAEGWATYRLHQELIGTRRRHPWLHRARTETVELTNRRLVYDCVAGEHRLRVTLDLDREWTVDNMLS